MVQTNEAVSHAALIDSGSNQLYFADWGGIVYAVDVASGEVSWKQQVQKPKEEWPWYGFAGTGALGEGMLFEASVEGMAYALDMRSGEVAWQHAFADENKHAGNVGKVLYYDGLVYIGVQSIEEPLTRKMKDFKPSFRGKVVALDAKTGQLAWESILAEEGANGVAVWSGFALD